MKTRLLIITEYSGLGGGETSLFHLIKNVKDLYSMQILTLEDGKLNEKLRDISVPEHSVNYKDSIRKFKIFSLYKNLKKYIENTDIVLLNSKSCLYLIPLIKFMKNIPVYYVEHSNWTTYSILEKKLLKLNHKIFVVSDDVKMNISKQLDIQHKIVDFPLGIKTNLQGKAKNIDLKRKFIVAMIGRFQKIKGHDLFVHLAGEVVDREPGKFQFLIIGGTPFGTMEEKEYENQVKSLIKEKKLDDKLLLLGERNDVGDLLKDDIDILIIPSENESFGMVTIEAANFGVPVITSQNCKGPKEILTNLEVPNLVVDRDVQSFKEKLYELCENPCLYNRISCRLYSNVKKYSIDNTSEILKNTINIK